MRKVNIFSQRGGQGCLFLSCCFLVTHVVRGTRSVVMISSVQEASLKTLYPAGPGCWGGWRVCWLEGWGGGETCPHPCWALQDSFSYMFSLSLRLCPLPALFFCSSVLCDDLERFTDFSSKPPFCPSQKASCIGQSSLEKQN